VVASAISSVIMLMIYSAHKTIMFSVRDLAGIAEFHENINLSMRHIDRDISCIIVNPDNKQLIFKGQNDTGRGASVGSIDMITINRRSFIALGDIDREAGQTDVKQVRYYLKKDPKFQGLFFMMRSEKNLYDTKTEDGNDDTIAPETESLLLENVVDLKFEFMAETKWDDKWSTTTPPRAVRTTIKLKNYRGQDESFSIVSTLHMAKKAL
jgi:hypothetical protein